MASKAGALITVFTGMSLTCSIATAPASAQAPPFYDGKQLSIYVGFPAGAGFDLFARMVARYIGDHIPGKPAVIVRNMPGAGGATVVNHTQQSLPKDGTAITLVNPVMATASFLQPDLAKWDAREFTWLGAPNSEITFCIFWDHSKIATLGDLARQDRPINMAGAGASGVTLDALTLRSLMGWKWNMVMGYSGLADAISAGERGEVDGACGLTASTLKTRLAAAVRERKVRVLLATSRQTHPDFQEAQSAFALAKTDEQRDIMSLVFGPWRFGRPFIAPPGVPAERVEILKKALLEVTADKRMVEEAGKLGFDLGFVAPKEIQQLVESFYAVPVDVKEKARDIIQMKQ